MNRGERFRTKCFITPETKRSKTVLRQGEGARDPHPAAESERRSIEPPQCIYRRNAPLCIGLWRIVADRQKKQEDSRRKNQNESGFPDRIDFRETAGRRWWALRDSNPEPRDYEGPLSLWRHVLKVTSCLSEPSNHRQGCSRCSRMGNGKSMKPRACRARRQVFAQRHSTSQKGLRLDRMHRTSADLCNK